MFKTTFTNIAVGTLGSLFIATGVMAQDGADAKSAFGDKNVQFTEHPAFDFVCWDGNNQTDNMDTAAHGGGSDDGRYDQAECSNADSSNYPDGGLIKVLKVPHGALMEGIRIWGYDDGVAPGGKIRWRVQKICQPSFGPGEATRETVMTDNNPSGPGYFSRYTMFPNDGETIDKRACYYLLQVQEAYNDEHYLQKVRVQWRRQIAPPPAVATFFDVPETHSFYKEIEALVGSGITGGCSTTNYCPDDTLTRGQMAAFLARALGINYSSTDSN